MVRLEDVVIMVGPQGKPDATPTAPENGVRGSISLPGMREEFAVG
jgi:hypothetical protein